MTESEYKTRISSFFRTPNDELKRQAHDFLAKCSYVSGSYDDDEKYIALEKHIRSLEDLLAVNTAPSRNRLFYLALPPSVFGQVSQHLRRNVYPGNEGSARVIIEKPFGHDLESSQKLQAELAPIWDEAEVFRIDHYLGKEMVKNILPFRFENPVFSDSWSNKSISNVQISFKEPFGTEGRGGYFDTIGIIRDVMQNHLLQVLSLVAMDHPVSFSSEDIRDAKVKLLKSIAPITLNDTVIGQYGKSALAGKQLPAYLDDKTVPSHSRAATFAAIHLRINNEKWHGVPFILTAGKALNESLVEIRIQFKAAQGVPRNELVFRVQPQEAISLTINSKFPGPGTKVTTTSLDLTYGERYTKGSNKLKIPEAYEALILDCLNDDHSNFVRDDELEVSWKIFTPLLHKIDNDESIAPELYAYGSNGPASLAPFLAKRGCSKTEKGSTYGWHSLKANL